MYIFHFLQVFGVFNKTDHVHFNILVSTGKVWFPVTVLNLIQLMEYLLYATFSILFPSYKAISSAMKKWLHKKGGLAWEAHLNSILLAQ